MSLVHYEVVYHPTDKPKNTHRIRLLTGEDPACVDKYLIRKYGAGKVVLQYAEREQPAPPGRKRTCGYCGCTRTEYYENVPQPLHPAIFNEALWRQL